MVLNMHSDAFKERFRDFQHICREIIQLRNLNKAGKSDNDYLLFAEATITCMAIERFLRILPALNAKKSDSLKTLLEKALIEKTNFAYCQNDPEFTKAKNLIDLVRGVRDGILHGDFESRAKYHKVDRTSYFNQGCFTKDIECVYIVFNDLVRLIDPATGLPHSL